MALTTDTRDEVQHKDDLNAALDAHVEADQGCVAQLAPVDGPLCALVAGTSACVLRPHSFMVAWSGVLTLAMRGLPPALAELKQRLNSSLEGLPAEQPGSLWPKCSLGCLRDGKRLTPEQLSTLQRICTETSGTFQVLKSGGRTLKVGVVRQPGW